MLSKIRWGICNFAFLGRWYIDFSPNFPSKQIWIIQDKTACNRCGLAKPLAGQLPMSYGMMGGIQSPSVKSHLSPTVKSHLDRVSPYGQSHLDYFQSEVGNAPWRTVKYIEILFSEQMDTKWEILVRKYKTRDGWSTVSIWRVSIPITRKIEILKNIPDFHRGIRVSTLVPFRQSDILPGHQREVNFRRPLQLDTFHGISQRLLICCCAWIHWMSFFWERNLLTLKGCQLLVKLLACWQEAWGKDGVFAQMQVPLAQPQRDNAAGGWNCPVCNNYNYAIRTTKRDEFQTSLGWRDSSPSCNILFPDFRISKTGTSLPVLPRSRQKIRKSIIFFLLFPSRWWFQYSLFHPYLGKMNPFWLIFFRWIETTNQPLFSLELSEDQLQQMCDSSPDTYLSRKNIRHFILPKDKQVWVAKI